MDKITPLQIKVAVFKLQIALALVFVFTVFISLFDPPYQLYYYIHWIAFICLAFISLLYLASLERYFSALLFAALFIIYQPLQPFIFNKGIWVYINLWTIYILFNSIVMDEEIETIIETKVSDDKKFDILGWGFAITIGMMFLYKILYSYIHDFPPNPS